MWVILFQKALKEQQIDIQEVHKDVLGTDKEKEVPSKTSWPWIFLFCGWKCSSPFTFKLPITDDQYETRKHALISTCKSSNEPTTEL